MRLTALALALAVLLTGAAWAQSTHEPTGLFRGLQASYTAMSWVDLGTTYMAVKWDKSFYEKNPIARAYIDHVGATILLQLASDLAVHSLAGYVYKQNKPAAYAFVGVMWVVRAYVLYHNFKVLAER